jgi:TolB-like protein
MQSLPSPAIFRPTIYGALRSRSVSHCESDRTIYAVENIGLIILKRPLKAGLEELGEQIVKAVPEDKQLRIAVADFPDLQNITSNLGRYIANRLTTRFTQSQKFFVVERQRLEQVLHELRFSMSDLVDPAKAKKLGHLVGVEAILVGTISDLGNQVDIDARIIEIETSRTVLSATASISKDQTVTELMNQGRAAPVVAAVPGSSVGVQVVQVPVAPPPADGTNTFQNSFLRITSKSISKAANKTSVNLVLQFENLTEEDLYIAFLSGSPTLLDDQDNVFGLYRVNGIAQNSTGYAAQQQYYTLFTPKTPHIVAMVFTSREESEGSVFNFSADCFRYGKESYVQFSVGITDIRIQ